jgi:hypothetical protein
MSRRLLSVLVLACIATGAGMLAYSASATVPTNKLYSMLNGKMEAPGPGDANANGAALVTLRPSTNQVCISIRFRQIDGTVNAMHIHDGPKGVPGPIVVDLTSALSSGGVGCGTASTALINEIRSSPRGFYCNVHSTPDFAGGAIRGQLFDSDI